MLRPLFLALCCAAASHLHAQTPAATATPAPSGTQTTQPLWRCTLPGGIYEVAVRAIVAVTVHEYLVDGAARVTEVNIDTTGSLLARFYFIEPNTPNAPMGIGGSVIDKAQQLLTEGVERTGQDAWKKVMKSYPTTTHARTVEYRLTSKDQINKIYESAEESFRLNRNKTLKIE